VGGSLDKFYPIVFVDNSWVDGIFELEISRANVHTDSQWRGSLMSRFTSHSSNWGHGADLLRAEVRQNKLQFVADFKNVNNAAKIVVWLRGGDTTYFWRSNQSAGLEDSKAVAKTVNDEKFEIKSAVNPNYAKENYSTTADEPWQTPTLENKWVRYSDQYNPAGYYKDSTGIVHLRGLVKNGAIGQSIFTLPAGYRPGYRELQAVQTNSNTIGRLDVLADGKVLATSGNATWFSIDGVTFRAV
jgi:hypothetical protein